MRSSHLLLALATPTAAAFLGSERSTWTGNVELQRSAYGRRSSMFGQSGGAPLARTNMAG